MSQRVVAFVGISGVGKTTFLRQLAQLIDFQHLTGGSLIAIAREVVAEMRDSIRYADLVENQRYLIEGFAIKLDPDANLVVMDGHVVIDDGDGLSKISSDVFAALGVSLVVHLESEPEQIFANREGDRLRSRPTYPASILEKHQALSRARASDVAKTLGVPFYIVTQSECARLAGILGACQSE